MKIYTKTGDRGQTGLFDGRRVNKNHGRLETYGTLDELNSLVGLALAECPHADLRQILATLQHQIFDLGADLATPLDAPHAAKVRRVSPEHVSFLEQQIDATTARVEPLRQFVLPGGSVTAARLHVCRTVCRRAERQLVTLMQQEDVGPQPLVYVNRLSDLLFVLARLANHLDEVQDIPWQPGHGL